MEKLIELIKRELHVHTLSLVGLIQKIHLQIDQALAILSHHTVGGRHREFVIEIHQLSVVHLRKQIFQLLLALGLQVPDALDCLEDGSRLVTHAALFNKSRILLVPGAALLRQ